MKSERTPHSERNSVPPPYLQPRRLPRGYEGIGHEMIGAVFLSFLDAILMPEPLLGKERCRRLRSKKAGEWYPVAELLEPLEHLDSRLSSSSIRRIGWSIFKLSHEAAVVATCSSARDVLSRIDKMYRQANRGDAIGGWQVLSFEPGRALLEKTTPHHCAVEEGIIEASLRAIGLHSTIYQPRCFRQGAESCQFSISSHVTGPQWTGDPGKVGD